MTSPASSSDGSSSSFGLLAEPIRRWIWKKGWTSLRDIQERSIPTLIKGDQDLIISAATAAGKTEAAFLPLISRVLTASTETGFDLVYIGPLRALINDQFGRLEDLCEAIELPVHPWHGDISSSVKNKARKQPSGILLITPESLEALFVLRGTEITRLFASTQAVIIDELHALLDSERGIHLRSLLTRLEMALRRPVRRVGLSATLGDMTLACSYLRPEKPDAVLHLESRSEGQELRVQIRGYVRTGQPLIAPTDDAELVDDEKAHHVQEYAAERAVAAHLFAKLRGKNNLVFAGSRRNVEIYSDLLRSISDTEKVPQEFFAHHASLAREHRQFVEQRLKEGNLPTTAICTSTLELGIDIGDVACVGQIGAPFSVADLRQRLGRSGRRAGQPSVLRLYVIEDAADAQAHPIDRLHLDLIRAIAMIELLIEGWCEPPAPHALHLSTLIHQILSVIAERGGASASRLFTTLCDRGPFRSVDQALFKRLLRQMGDPKVALIEQAPDQLLLLGRQGERIVEHYSFYAAFKTPEEFRIVHQSATLGTLPIDYPLNPGMTIIFSGRRWCVLDVHDLEKTILVAPDHAGVPPKFGGDSGVIHDEVVARMRSVLADCFIPTYLDKTAADLLALARAAFAELGLSHRSMIALDEQGSELVIATWTGTVKTSSLAMVLAAEGFSTEVYEGMISVSVPKSAWSDDLSEDGTENSDDLEVFYDGSSKLASKLEQLAAENINLEAALRGDVKGLIHEKFHPFLGPDLLFDDALSGRLDLMAVPHLAAAILAHGSETGS